MLHVDILDPANPMIYRANVGVSHRGQNPSTAVVTTHDDMAYFQYVHRIVQHSQKVHVVDIDEIGYVTVHKNLAAVRAGDLVGGDARVGTPYPQKIGTLALSELFKKTLGLLLTFRRQIVCCWPVNADNSLRLCISRLPCMGYFLGP